VLQATWTMTRTNVNYDYSFNGGGTIQTVAGEPSILGTNYNPALPPVKVRATLLGRGSDTVFQGNPYSAMYGYCFPFLWVQETNEVQSVYPAVYEWYRGTPTISNAVIVNTDPLQAQVTTASGQVDTYTFTTNYCLAVSRDTNGIRWVKLSGFAQVSLPDLTLNPGPNYDVSITDINYSNRTLTTSSPLPDDPGVMAGNSGRRVWLALQGSGTHFTWQDDLLVQEGRITSLHVTGSNSIAITSDQPLLFDGYGNRNSSAMTVATEDGQWHFRNNQVIKSPAGVPLTSDAFADANGDGVIDMKTYEIGIGDHLSVPAEITVERSPSGWHVQSNVSLHAVVEGTTFDLVASDSRRNSLRLVSSSGLVVPLPPSNLRVLPK
jgi:hypothetical protein